MGGEPTLPPLTAWPQAPKQGGRDPLIPTVIAFRVRSYLREISMPVWLLYSIVVFVWGSSWIAIKYQIDTISPELSIVYRMALAGLLTILYCFFTGKSLRFNFRQHCWIAFQGIFLFCMNYILLYFAGLHLTSGLLAICFSAVTLMNIFNSALIYKTAIQARTLFAALIGILGLVLIFYPEVRDFSASGDKIIGIFLALAATFSASLGMMISVTLRKMELPVLQSNALGMIYGAAVAFIVTLLLQNPLLLPHSWSYIFALVYLAVPSTIIGFACYLTLIAKIGPSRAAYSSVLFPVVALAISTVAENYHWTIWAILGIAAVLAGNVLVLTKPKAEAIVKAAE